MTTGPSRPSGVPASAAGYLCVAALSGLRLFSPAAAGLVLAPLLPVYFRLRPGHSRRLRACFAASPFSESLGIGSYYRVRLRLFLHLLRLHGQGNPDGAGGNGKVRIEGESHYARALENGRPLALIGLHAGLFELLHRIPRAPEGRPFRILTAKAFSPPLTRFMAEGRERDGKKILWVGGEGDKGLERGVREVAAGKGVLALMADQHPGGSGETGYLRLWNRIAVPYPARMLRFLAARGFTLLPVSTRVDGNGEALFRYHPAWNDGPVPDPAGTAPGMEELARRFLEEAIAAAPEQWNWSYPKVAPAAP